MKTRRRRALSAEEQTMAPAERAEMRELGSRARFNAQSPKYRADIAAIRNGDPITKPSQEKT